MRGPSRVAFLQRPGTECDAGRIGLELRKISRAKSTASERKLPAVVCAVSAQASPTEDSGLYSLRVSERVRRQLITDY
jgi:hypothetical protein